jgi:cellulose synthase/poly-beta-1,6-N-acetylglucosamine synthase-like glycosyltransferase
VFLSGSSFWGNRGEESRHLTSTAPSDRLRDSSAVVFGYDELPSLRRLLPRVLSEPLGRVVVAYGGTDGSREYVESIRDSRLIALPEGVREGKWKAYNRAVAHLQGSTTFLLCGDIVVPPGLFSRIQERMVPPVGAIIPQIVPRNLPTFIARLGHVLWHLHDAELAQLSARGKNVHGGEFMAIRTDLLEPIPAVVNEDAYLCLKAAEKGHSVLYARDLVVENTVPETLPELLRQRARVNYGHTQLMKMGLDPRVLDRLLFRSPGEFVSAMLEFARRYPSDLFLFPMLAALEIAALRWGRIDFRRRVDYTLWPMVRSGKQEPFAP